MLIRIYLKIVVGIARRILIASLKSSMLLKWAKNRLFFSTINVEVPGLSSTCRHCSPQQPIYFSWALTIKLNRWWHIRQQQCKTDCANDDFELSRRVWGSIETLFKESGYWKIWEASLVHDQLICIQLVRIFSSIVQEGEVKLEKWAITLRYAMDAERICKFSK